MFSLTPQTNQRNPWYGDYWQEVHGCLLPHNHQPQSDSTIDHQQQSTTQHQQQSSAVGNISICPAGLRLTHLGYEQDSKIQFVVDAVYAFAHAISALQRDVCAGFNVSQQHRRQHNNNNNRQQQQPTVYGACPQLLSYDGGDFYTKYLLNVSFVGNVDWFNSSRLFSVVAIDYILFANHSVTTANDSITLGNAINHCECFLAMRIPKEKVESLRWETLWAIEFHQSEKMEAKQIQLLRDCVYSWMWASAAFKRKWFKVNCYKNIDESCSTKGIEQTQITFWFLVLKKTKCNNYM